MGDFPILDVPMVGGGLTIGLIAIFHVMLAHYAVGTGMLLYALERADRSAENAGVQRMLDLLGLSVVYVSFVIGAISGVGIWFAISIFSPDATQHLIQKFVWLWATEYTFFAIEIVVGYLYYYRRRKLGGRQRRQLALVYMLSSWGSLLVITGILSAMLTWREGNALVGWLNASAVPSVLLRTLSALAIACLVVLVLSAIKPLFPYARASAEKQAVYRTVYRLLVWFFLLLPIAIWYRLSIPARAAAFAEGSSVPISMFLAGTILFSVVVTLFAFFAYRYRRVLQFEGAALLLILGLVATFTAEFVREGIRKPYIIAPILYSNAIWVHDLPEWRERSRETGSVLLVDRLYPGTKAEKVAGAWQLPVDAVYDELTPAERGNYIFRSQCLICHTRYGFNAILHLTRAWHDERYATETLRSLNVSKPFMPPFVGTKRDAADLIAYIQSIHAPTERAIKEERADAAR